MQTIGLRASTTEIFYIVLTGSCDEPNVSFNGKLRMPKSHELPSALHWCRKNLKELFTEHSIDCCGIKMAEPISRSMGSSAYQGAIIRANIEGVLMETSESSGIPVVAGPFATISSLTGLKNPKQYLDNNKFKEIDSWGELNKSFREAALASFAALCFMEKK